MKEFVQRKPSDAKFSHKDINGNDVYMNEKFAYIKYKSEYGTMYYRWKRGN